MPRPWKSPHDRPGFTLVELLMVIVIIGLLAGMITAVAFKVIVDARVARVVMEINNLDMAMREYRNQRGDFPPNMGMVIAVNGAFDPVARETKFTRHVRRAFPRSTLTYVNVRNNMRNARDPTKDNYDYTYKAKDGSIQNLELDTLDQAEALVFWLAGFPTPWDSKNTAAIAPRRLFGFHKDPLNPWKRDPRAEEAPRPFDFRSPLLFQFDEARLVDNDDDGWPEYVPMFTSVTSDSQIPPYVYFDYQTYVSLNASGQIEHDAYPPATSPLRSTFGIAVPYALSFDPNGQSPTRWVNPDSFQIICASLDGMYGSAAGTSGGMPKMRVPVFPSGATFRQDDNYSKQTYYDQEELDNLTNFTERKLNEAEKTTTQ